MYSIIPFVLLAVINVMLIYSTKFHNKVAIAATTTDSKIKKRRQMTITVFLITFLFILMTLPGSFGSIFFVQKINDYNFIKKGAIVSGFYFLSLSQTQIGSAVIILMDDISFSYHAFNFFTLLLTNKKFLSEFYGILFRVGILKSAPHIQNLGTTMSTMHAHQHNPNQSLTCI